MVWTGFVYGKRQFDKLPEGFINSTDFRVIDTGYLDHPESLIINQGIGVMWTGTIGDVARVKIPDSTIVTNTSFFGIISHDHAHYRKAGQALFTYFGTQMAPIIREAREIRVRVASTTTYGGRVYLIHTAGTGGAANELPGMFKSTQGSNSIEIPARFIETLGTITNGVGVASLELMLGTSRFVA